MLRSGFVFFLKLVDFKIGEEDVNDYIEKLREELGLPNEAASSSVGAEIIHGIMWFISKIQEGISDLTPSIPGFDQHTPTENMVEKLERLGDTLLEQGLEEVNQVISTLINTISNAVSDPKMQRRLYWEVYFLSLKK